MSVYVRWKTGESRRGRVFDSPPDEYLANLPCPACLRVIGYADSYQLFIVGPDPGDEEQFQKWADGRWFTALAAVCHEWCVARLSDPDLERLAETLEVRSV